jgi:two-component system response regulator HydG
MHAQDFHVMPAQNGTEDLMAKKSFIPSVPIAPLNVLVIDDEKSIRDGCRQAAEGLGFKTHVAENAGNAYKALESQNIDVVLLDMKLPGSTSGQEMLRDIRSRYPNVVIIVMTGYATIPAAVQAMRLGAYDYLSKPFNLEELRVTLERAASHFNLATENRVLRTKLRSKEGFGNMIGRSPQMEKLYRFISKAANSHHPVLILGESGTGKELVARSIHFNGPQKDKPFIPVDCGSLVPTLIESELFGHVKGAFTGANQAKEGLLTLANGGTVFLDEIGELPSDLQAKLLRAIQEKEIRPVGSTRRVPIDARILAATNHDLDVAVQNGSFRRDLYFRLNVLTLRVPPLRERKQDIPVLAGHFLERIQRTGNIHRTVSDEALRRMLEYDWPGNVRELENCLERACAMNSGPVIHVIDLGTPLQLPRSAAAPTSGNGVATLADLEKSAILAALQHTHGDKLQAADLLGIGKTTLYRKLKEYGPQI